MKKAKYKKCSEKGLLIFGSFKSSPDDSRSNTLIEGFKNLGWKVTSCTVNLGILEPDSAPVKKILIACISAPIRWFVLFAKYFFMSPHEIIFIPYNPYVDSWVGCVLGKLSGRLILIDSFMGLYDTLVKDRRLFKQKSFFAQCIRLYEKIILHSVDKSLVDTEEQAEMLQQYYSLPEGRVLQIPVGIDEALWKPTQFPPREKNFNVLFWSTFIPLHGVEIVAMAAKQLESFPEIHFIIIGNGQLGNEFKTLLDNLNPTNITWINRFIAISTIQKYVNKAHCCLGVFGKEEKTQRVIPYKAYQTIASSKPLITARTCASSRVFSDRKNVILVPKGDHIALAEAIKELFENRELAFQIGQEGRKLYELLFSNKKIEQRLGDIIETLANKSL